jgi:hypothetical protein
VKLNDGIRAAWILGLAGLIPFAAGAVAVWSPQANPAAANVLGDYAACILSFLGGVRWGTDIPHEPSPRVVVLALSVLPPLIAWIAICIQPFTGVRATFVILIAAFALQGVWDVRSTALPRWMGRLRAVLTLGALASLVAAVLAS